MLLTKNLNDMAEGFPVLAKGVVLRIAFHLNQPVFKGGSQIDPKTNFLFLGSRFWYDRMRYSH